jgi:hypothetical protein
MLNFKDEKQEVKDRAMFKLRKDVAKSVMKMNLSCDQEGYVYFNNLLYAVVKRAYASEILKNITREGMTQLTKSEATVINKLEQKTKKVNKHRKLTCFDL